jgi:hypothetical protein
MENFLYNSYSASPLFFLLLCSATLLHFFSHHSFVQLPYLFLFRDLVVLRNGFTVMCCWRVTFLYTLLAVPSILPCEFPCRC